MLDQFLSPDSTFSQTPPTLGLGHLVLFRAKSKTPAATGGHRNLLPPGILLNLLSLSITPMLSDAIGPALTLSQGKGDLL